MTIQTKRKWILLLAVVLLAAALSVGSTSLWKAEKEKRGEGYVAVVRIDGAIYGGPETDSMLSGSSGSSSEEIMRELQEARKDPQAKAILIRINSPGGSTGATQEIAEEMDKIRSSKKPIVISMGDMCASAGYWLASKGNYIFASPATMTGSIGVYMDYTNIEDLMDKVILHNHACFQLFCIVKNEFNFFLIRFWISTVHSRYDSIHKRKFFLINLNQSSFHLGYFKKRLQ